MCRVYWKTQIVFLLLTYLVSGHHTLNADSFVRSLKTSWTFWSKQYKRLIPEVQLKQSTIKHFKSLHENADLSDKILPFVWDIERLLSGTNSNDLKFHSKLYQNAYLFGTTIHAVDFHTIKAGFFRQIVFSYIVPYWIGPAAVFVWMWNYIYIYIWIRTLHNIPCQYK